MRTTLLVKPMEEYESQSARDAQRMEYGERDYWEYLEAHAKELHAKGVADAMTRTLTEALQGNDGG